jgi:hypothetical protein
MIMPSLTRRAVLITGGASATILAAVGFAAWAPGTASATEPWRRAGESLGDPRLDALAYAILAPNPHNRQPWTFRLVGSDRIDIGCDLERRLPHTDPFDRQITVGFGCMLELLRIAAAEKGYAATITVFPDGEPAPRLDGRRVASVHFTRDQGVARDPLARHILSRRSIKTVYADRAVPQRSLAAITGAAGPGVVAGGTVDPARARALAALAWDAWQIEYATARTRRESIDLMRIGNAEVAANPDGIELGGIPMGLMRMTGIVSRDALDTPGSTAYQQGLDMFDPIIHSAPGFAWLISPANTRADQIAAGRAWVRMNLAATAAGVAMHPLSQALQEFPEMRVPYRAVHRALGAGDGRTVQMLGRIGYADSVDPTPRWPLETHLVGA